MSLQSISLHRKLMSKGKVILDQKFPDDITTVREFRRRMSCIRLNNEMLNLLMRDFERKGMIKCRRDGVIIIAKKMTSP